MSTCSKESLVALVLALVAFLLAPLSALAAVTDQDVDGLANLTVVPGLTGNWDHRTIGDGVHTITLVDSDWGSSPDATNKMICVYTDQLEPESSKDWLFTLNGAGDARTIAFRANGNAWFGFLVPGIEGTHGGSWIAMDGGEPFYVEGAGHTAVAATLADTWVPVTDLDEPCLIRLLASDFSSSAGAVNQMVWVYGDQYQPQSYDYWLFTLNGVNDTALISTLAGAGNVRLGFVSPTAETLSGGSRVRVNDDGHIHVRPDGTGDLATIQAAIDACPAGSVVDLADGVYTGAGNRGLDYRGKAITVRSESGNPESCIIDCEGADRGFYFTHDEGACAVVEGITIRGGVAPDNGLGEHWGGGIACATTTLPGAIPTIRNCIFRDNSAATGGGGLYTSGEGGIIEGCLFVGNDSALGGGACVVNGAPDFRDCIFAGNHAEQTGGGLGAWLPSAGTILRCTFRDNHASYGGGAGGDTGFDLLFRDCVFEDNLADNRGGAVFCQYDSSPALIGCVLVRNRGDQAQYGDGGSALWCSEGAPVLQNCTISDNASPTAAVVVGDDGVLTIANTIIAHSTEGMAVWLTGYGGPSSAVISCSDFYGNAGGDWVGEGIASQSGVNGNFSEPPRFCDRSANLYTLDETSACAAENCPGQCGQVGALGVGCAVSASAGEDLVLASTGLEPAVPNPFSSAAALCFRLAAPAADAVLAVYDLQGRCVRTLRAGRAGAGSHTAVWDGRDERGNAVAGGSYFAVLRTEAGKWTTRLVLVR